MVHVVEKNQQLTTITRTNRGTNKKLDVLFAVTLYRLVAMPAGVFLLLSKPKSLTCFFFPFHSLVMLFSNVLVYSFVTVLAD